MEFFVLFLALIGVGIFAFLNGIVLKKAGYSLWWLLLIFFPLFYLIMVWVFAYSDWPSQRESLPEDA